MCYRVGFAYENEDLALTLWQADELLTRILSDCNADGNRIFISGDNNFRYNIFPDYKINRKDKPKPKWLEQVREHLVVNWNAEIVDGYEADDALAINRSPESIICSIDKDLLQIPGEHYNFVKREQMVVDEFTGWYNFYTQCLVGDPGDNIKGCKGIGKAKAPKVLDNCKNSLEMYNACLKMYIAQGQQQDDLTLACRLLYILRQEGDRWTSPEDVPAAV